jgi:hypothetical protein
MRLLQNKTNVDAPDDDYPFGRARNNPGNRTGTPVDEELVGDILQFFEKMFNASGLVANELPDNDYTGFQLFEAFDAYIQAKIDAALAIINPDGLRVKLVPIINWNMSVDDNIIVDHGLTAAKIVSINVLIRRDADSDSRYVQGVRNAVADVDGSDLFIGQTVTDSVRINRRTGSFFDDASFSQVGGYVRGYLVIVHMP